MSLKRSTPARSHHTIEGVLDDRNLSVAEKRAVLSAWCSDLNAVPSKPWLRAIPGGWTVPVAAILAALRSLDDDDPRPSPKGAGARQGVYHIAEMTPRAVWPEAASQVPTTTPDNLDDALIVSHRRNIDRYCRLLATQLSKVEREFVHRRIAEERREMERVVERREKHAHMVDQAEKYSEGLKAAHLPKAHDAGILGARGIS
jgi:hypothetical protein